MEIENIKLSGYYYKDHTKAEKLIEEVKNISLVFEKFETEYYECGSHALRVEGVLELHQSVNMESIVRSYEIFSQLSDLEKS